MLQKILYMENESRNKLSLMEENELLQISNIVYPGASDKPFGKSGLENVMNVKQGKINTYSYKPNMYKKYGPIFTILILLKIIQQKKKVY